MKLRSRAMVCLLSLSSQAWGQDAGSRTDGAVADAESRYLFINMLEFLGEFETSDGEWVSPEILDDDAFADLDSSDSVNGRQDEDLVNSNPGRERDNK